MALYPAAIQRLIPRHNRTPIKRYRRMNLHVAVSEASSLAGYFATVGDCSHFYVRKDGTVEQYIDTRYESHADFHGNDSTLSVETQGGLRNAQGEPWTAAQVQALAKLWAWARDTHDIPNRIATGTATVDESLGLSWHRLGVVGFGETVNIRYSRSVGKICPGDAKISQVPTIFALADGASLPAPGGGTSVPTPTAPAPSPKPPSSARPKTYARLYVDGHRGPVTVKAWQILLTVIGNYDGWIDGQWGPLSVRAEQSWLKGLGYYTGLIDGQEGPMTIRALQRFLTAKRLAPGLVDGRRGPLTVKAEQRYLNDQRQHLK